MPDYDFKSLSPIDFEILVRDLLQKEREIRLESFKVGQDQGIDFRYCSDVDNTLIIQCKHYVESSYNTLLRQLKLHELEKVKRLEPNCYILATSLGLNPKQKQELMKLFEPFIQAPKDIYGKDDLNNLLGLFPRVEKQNFKLWFASVHIFEEILHSTVKNISRDALETIREHAKYYVQNESFSEALKILNDHNFCVIAGIPGIGKTILAEMLSLHFVNLGYDIVKIDGDISEANSIDYINQKRIFYYDDFLGQTSLSEKLNKNEDQKILDFIQSIKRSKVSKLILTTREYILNQAQISYEKIARSNLDLETYVIDLSKYTRFIRAKILFNHIYFSDLPIEYKKELLRERNYLKIIDHKNYNPRIIYLMTQFSRIAHFEPGRYLEFFISNLENPSEIWRHAFEEQLSLPSRNLLVILASMPKDVFMEDLQEAFLTFHKKLSIEYGFGTTPKDFMQALKELNGNFISSEKSKDRTIINFHNPSVRDFVQNFLASSEAELQCLIKEATFCEQIMWLWEFNEINSVALKFRRTIIQNSDHFVASLRATFNSRNCRLITHVDINGERYKDTWEMSFELRVIFLVSVVCHLESENSKKLLDEMLKVVEKQVDNESANRDDLVRLLIKLKNSELISPTQKRQLFEKAKTFLMSDLISIDDFEAYCDFVNSFPEMLTANEKEIIQKYFMEFVDDIDTYGYTDDPDIIRQDANTLGILAITFDVDINSILDNLEFLVQEKEDEIPQDRYEDRSHSESYYNDCSDQDIESLFNELNE